MSLKFLNRIRKTIGFRLILWYSIIFILSSLALFFSAYLYLSSSIRQRDREIIQSELNECATKYYKGGINALQKEVEFEKRVSGKNSFFVRLAGAENTALLLNIPDQGAKFDLKQLENIAINGNGQWLYLTAKDDGDILEIASLRLTDGSLLQVGKSTEGREETLGYFQDIFASVVISVILLGFTVGVFLASRTLRPIRGLINTLRSIGETGKIDARVQVSKSGDELKELYLTTDRNRLRQILANLMDNAIKYTPSGGRVDIETHQREQQVVIIVKDTGIGIPPEELSKIWDRLYRGDKSRSQRGLGLGLSLVRAIVHAHGGYIGVSSEPGTGSLFTVYLPIEP